MPESNFEFRIQRCPGSCGRLTYTRRRMGGTRRLTQEQQEEVRKAKAIQATLHNGLCPKCWMFQHGYGRGGPGRQNDPSRYRKYPPGYMPPATEYDLERARVAIRRYEVNRQLRGIPEGGASTDILVRPGLFCKDVT